MSFKKAETANTANSCLELGRGDDMKSISFFFFKDFIAYLYADRNDPTEREKNDIRKRKNPSENEGEIGITT